MSYEHDKLIMDLQDEPSCYYCGEEAELTEFGWLCSHCLEKKETEIEDRQKDLIRMNNNFCRRMFVLVVAFLAISTQAFANPYNHPSRGRNYLRNLRRYFERISENRSTTTDVAEVYEKVKGISGVYPPENIQTILLNIKETKNIVFTAYDKYDANSGEHTQYGIVFGLKIK